MTKNSTLFSRISQLFLCALMLFTLPVTLIHAATTDTTLSDGWYYIKNVNAQKYLQVTNNTGGNGVNVEIDTGTGVAGQKWYLTNTGDGYITLENKQGYMLDVAYGSNEDGVNIQTYSANNADAQKFKLTPISSYTHGILTKASNNTKGLDVYNWETSDGANVCQWTYYANKNQEWVFEPCSTSSSNDSSEVNKTMKQISDEYMANVRTTLVAPEPSDVTTRKNNVQYGSIVKRQYYSSVTERMTNLNVMLPAGYNPSKKYPVLYLLHGYWGTEDSLLDAGDVTLKINEIISNLTAEGAAKEMIVVFPYIYTSKYQAGCSGLDLANSLAYDNFINALVTDIMPFINSQYSTLTDRANTAIAGFSMGGREALYIGITRPDLFGYVAGFCPAPGVTPGADLNLHPGQLQTNEFKIQDENYMPYLIMIAGGTNDTVVFNQPYLYHNILDNNGVNNVWLEVPYGGHDSSTIRPGIYNFARSIFKN